MYNGIMQKGKNGFTSLRKQNWTESQHNTRMQGTAMNRPLCFKRRLEMPNQENTLNCSQVLDIMESDRIR